VDKYRYSILDRIIGGEIMDVITLCKQYRFTNVHQINDNTFEIVNQPESWILTVNGDVAELKHANYKCRIGGYHLQKRGITVAHALNYIASHRSGLYINKPNKRNNRLDQLFAQIAEVRK
jgi:hypothetical protein